MLIDEGLEHSFITQECEDAFEEAVVAACKRRLKGDIGPFNWYEEWELVRIDNEGGENGVWIIATTNARSMQESVEQCVQVPSFPSFWFSTRWLRLTMVRPPLFSLLNRPRVFTTLSISQTKSHISTTM